MTTARTPARRPQPDRTTDLTWPPAAHLSLALSPPIPTSGPIVASAALLWTAAAHRAAGELAVRLEADGWRDYHDAYLYLAWHPACPTQAAVRRRLTALGIDPSRIKIEGPTRPGRRPSIDAPPTAVARDGQPGRGP